MTASPPETRASLILRLPNAADVAAWDEFIAVYGPVVLRVGRQQGLQPADVEDVVQEVFAAVATSVEHWLQRTDRGSFRAWLLRIARNTAVNFLTRRATRSLGATGAEAERLMAEMPAPGGELSHQFDLEYRREIFRQASDYVRRSVRAATWDAFWLTHVKGLSIAEAAAQLQMTTGNIYIARSRVMARLRERIEQFEVEP